MNELTCRDFIGFLDDYIAGEQPPAVRATFESHLTKCRQCADYLRTYRDTIRLAQGAFDTDALPPTVPDDLVRAIVTSLRVDRGH